jgi:hypothetical protein
MPPRIPITGWPNGPAVQVPDVQSFEVLALGADWNVLVYGTQLADVPVPDELLFGPLLDVDCDDVDAIAAFEQEHGRLGTWPDASWDHHGEHYPPFVADTPRAWKSATRVGNERWRRERRAALHSAFPDRVSANEVMGQMEWNRDTEVSDWSMTARALRACALHLEASTLPDSNRILPRVWREQGFDVKDDDGAMRWFGIIVNERLRPFHMCVLVPRFMEERLWWEAVELQNALALQIWNYVAENASFHRCENELCGKIFPIDFGGRKRRKYHSDACGRRQSVRNKRRRDRGQT